MNVFELFGTIGLKDAGFTKTVDEAAKKGTLFGKSFSDLMNGIEKAAVKGFGTAATAFGEFTKDSVKAYADYEQLAGGIEALFGDSADSVKQYAESAYKTAGLSANTYMKMITGFSVSLLQSLGGDAEEAARIGNMAVTDMADNANRMGSTLESIQTAYQGLAADNFSVLGSLRLGYAGTAEEMARLINDSGVMGEAFEATAANVKDIPFDQMVLAIHAIQSEMGITGGVAEDVSETISGSWDALKSSWTNVLSGLASGNEELLSGSIEALISSAGEFAENAIEAVTNMVDALPGALDTLIPMVIVLFDTLLPTVIDGATKLVAGLVQIITNSLPAILEAGGKIIQTLLEGIFGENEQISTAFDAILNAFSTVMKAITESGLIENIVKLLEKLGEKALEITPLVAGIFGGGFALVIQGVSEAIGFLAENLDTIIPVIGTFFALWGGIEILSFIGQAGSLGTALSQITTAILGATTAKGQDLIVTARLHIAYAQDAIAKGISTVQTLAQSVATKAATAAGWLLNAAMSANPIGIVIAAIVAFVAVIIYLWNTNEEFRTALINAWNTIKETASNVWQAITKFFTEDMPAALGMLPEKFKEVGGNIIEGLWNGIENAKRWLKDKISGFFGGVVDDIKSFFGIKSPSKLFEVEIGAMLPAGLAEGVEKGTDLAVKATKMMAGSVFDAASGDIAMGVGIGGEMMDEQKEIVETGYEEIKETALSKLAEMSEKTMEIMRKMLEQVSMFLHVEGYNAGKAFVGALGQALIDEEARLYRQALSVANSIRSAFDGRGDEGGSMYGASTFQAEGTSATINQYFYGVKEEETAFETYRATQKAAEVMFV